MEYTALGRNVNLAGSLEPVIIKGFEKAADVYRVIGPIG